MKKFAAFVLVAAFFGAAVYWAKEGNKTAGAGHAEFGSQAPRGIAGLPAQQSMINQMNKIILAVTTRDQVAAAAEEIVKISKRPEAKDFPGVQLYGAVASLIPDLEGIVYRCRAFVETSDWLHMSWLFGLRDFSYNDYLYGPHVKAIFDFLTYPSTKAGPAFQKFSGLQDFALQRLAPKLENILKEGRELDKLPSNNFEFEFDRTVLVGQGSGLRFLDPEEANKHFIKPYFYTMTFILQRALSTIYYVAAMDLDELPVVFNRVIQATTINTVKSDLRLGNPAKGVTPMMAYGVIQGTKKFLRWREQIPGTTAQKLLDDSFKYGNQSAHFQLAAYVCGIKYPSLVSHGQAVELNIKNDCMSFEQESNPEAYFVSSGSKFLFNPNSMILGFKKKYHSLRDRVRVYEESYKGQHADLYSDVTGQHLKVNLKAFFDAKVSQRDLLPTGYVNASAASNPVAGMSGVKAWDYNHGKPWTFRDYTFNGFFDSTVDSPEALYHAMSTVLYTDAIAPFALWVRVPSTARFFIPLSEMISSN